MLDFKPFFLILGISLCTLTSTSEHKMDFITERKEQVKANQSTGSSAIDEIKADVAKLMNMVEQMFKKLDENSKKLENNSKQIGELMEKFDEKMNCTCDSVMIKGEYGSKVNESKAEYKVQLEQLETQLTLTNHTADFNRSILNRLNVCSPNPCNGGQCVLNATGSGYMCGKCPYATYGTQCQHIKCDNETKCFQNKNKAYFVFESKLDWAEANRKCLYEGMTLAMPKDRVSNEYLAGQLLATYGYAVVMRYVYFWFGLRTDANGQWEWTDGSPLGEYIGGRESFIRSSGPRCGLMFFSGGTFTWSSDPCTTSLFYPLCEKSVN